MAESGEKADSEFPLLCQMIQPFGKLEHDLMVTFGDQHDLNSLPLHILEKKNILDEVSSHMVKLKVQHGS